MEGVLKVIFSKPHLLTKLDIWSPRYKDKHGDLAEPVVLLAQYKVQQASPWILVDFSKAKHLRGLRFCIKRQDAESCPLDSSTKIPCYAVPLSKFESWDTVQEVKETVNRLWPIKEG